MKIRTIACGLVPVATLLIASTSMGKKLYAYLEQGNTPDGDFYTDCDNGNGTIEAYSIGYIGVTPTCNASTIYSGTGSSQSATCSSSATAHLANLYSGATIKCSAPAKSGAWDTDFSTGANSTNCTKFFNVKINGTGSCTGDGNQLPFEAHSMGSEN